MTSFPRIRVFLNLLEADLAWVRNRSPVLFTMVHDRGLGLTGIRWDAAIESLPHDGSRSIVVIPPEMMQDDHAWCLIAAACSRLGHLCIYRDTIPCARGNHREGEDYTDAVTAFLDAYTAAH